jgi:hypothetical protein
VFVLEIYQHFCAFCFESVSGVFGTLKLISLDSAIGVQEESHFQLFNPLPGRALINFMGNTITTVVIAKSENENDLVKYRSVVGKRAVSRARNL